jgi:hypothetical protein
VPVVLPVPLLSLLPEVPVEPPLAVPLELPDGLIGTPPDDERTDPDPLHAAKETTAAMIRLERRVRLRTLPEDMLRMIITPRTQCVPPVVGARK